MSDAEAIVERQAGRDVVVCGDDLAINRSTAERIETSANGVSKRCPPHVNAGPNALPHYQPKSRPRFMRPTNANRNKSDYEVFHTRTLLAVQFGSCVGGQPSRCRLGTSLDRISQASAVDPSEAVRVRRKIGERLVPA